MAIVVEFPTGSRKRCKQSGDQGQDREPDFAISLASFAPKRQIISHGDYHRTGVPVFCVPFVNDSCKTFQFTAHREQSGTMYEEGRTFKVLIGVSR